MYQLKVTGTGKRYLRVYIHLRFRHACHETRDRQSRSIASWQEWGGGGDLSAIEIVNTVENHEWTIKKKKNEICLLKSKFEVICEQFWRAVKRMSVRLFIKKKNNNKFWTFFRKVLKSD